MLSLAFNTQAYNAHVRRHISYFTLVVVNFLHPVRLLCVACASRVGVCGCGGAGQCVIPAAGWDLLVSVLSPFLLLLRQLLVLPGHMLLPETPSVQPRTKTLHSFTG